MQTRVRFAPSPTGSLHIGGVRTALFNWLWARKMGGQFILRIEDTDQARSTPESTQVILDSLKWLGMDWDEGPDVGGSYGPYTQMQRLALYKDYADRLVDAGLAYRCTCTKDDLAAQRIALQSKDKKAQFKYPKTCRGQKVVAPGTPHVVRFMAPTDGDVVYDDKVFGQVRTPNTELQDFVLIRSDGIPLYNFGSVVDDITMKITLVARGCDHMINTPSQILLYQALGAKIPDFAHLPMMLNQKGAKLSKRDGAVGVDQYRNAGFDPMGLMDYLVRFGWSHGDQEVFSRKNLIDVFSWKNCSRSDGRFDPKKADAVNFSYLKGSDQDGYFCSDLDYANRIIPFLTAKGISANVNDVLPLIHLVRNRAHTFVDAADKLDMFLRDSVVFTDDAVRQMQTPSFPDLLSKLKDSLDAVSFDADVIASHFNSFLQLHSLDIKDVGTPIRVALTGATSCPGHLNQVLVALGHAKTHSRLASAISRLKAQL